MVSIAEKIELYTKRVFVFSSIREGFGYLSWRPCIGWSFSRKLEASGFEEIYNNSSYLPKIGS
jgi:hypothetical protein